MARSSAKCRFLLKVSEYIDGLGTLMAEDVVQQLTFLVLLGCADVFLISF